MQQITLKSDINDKFRNNAEVILEIANAMGKSYGRVKNWFYEDSTMLTSYAALKIISKETGLKIDQLVTSKKVTA